MKRIAVLMPGRGAYTRRTMGTLPGDHPWVVEAEELRRGYGLTPLRELDSAERFRKAVHLRPDNASPLIYLCSMLDAEQAKAEHEAVCVAGNSMGWYSALAVAGALSFADGFRLVQEMSLLQMEFAEGGQIVYPLIDDQWRIDPRMEERAREAVESSNGEAFFSVDLGGYQVLAGTEKGIEHLLSVLPAVEMGPRLFPYRLEQHGPYHTSLLDPVAEQARRRLDHLEFRVPETALIDGRGKIFPPPTTDARELKEYTLGAQITTRFSFTTSVRVAVREFAPDLLALPGPGNSLGGISGQVVVAEGWRGIECRSDFERVQESGEPVVWSMRLLS